MVSKLSIFLIALATSANVLCCSGITKIAGISVRSTQIEDKARKLSKLIDSGRFEKLLYSVNQANEQFEGAFQVGWFQGKPYLSYGQDGTHFHFDAKGKLTAGPSELEKSIRKTARDPRTMQFRFAAPEGWHLIGMETNTLGFQIPIFSPSQKLSLFREGMSENKPPSFFGFNFVGDYSDANPRTAARIPLFEIEFHETHQSRIHRMKRFPQEIRQVLGRGRTLSTKDSLDYLDFRIVDEEPTPFEAIVISTGADQSQGRTGLLLHNGLPLLVWRNGQEYFVELKGLGVVAAPEKKSEIAPNRTHAKIRLGRMDHDQVENAWGAKKKMKQVAGKHASLLSQPAVSLALLELAHDDAKLRIEDRGRVDNPSLSHQLYRLATSTRRAAFSDNVALGDHIVNRPRTLQRIHEAYGTLVAEMMLRPYSEDPQYHNSPHGENTVLHLAHGRVLPTDFADVFDGQSLKILGDTKEFRLLEGNAAHDERFVEGLKNSLAPRGLWTERVEAALSQHPIEYPVLTRLFLSEYFAYFKIQALKEGRDSGFKPMELDRYNGVWLETIYNSSTRIEDLEIQFRRGFEPLTQLVNSLETQVTSSLVKKHFPTLHAKLVALFDEAQQLAQEVKTFHDEHLERRFPESDEFYWKAFLKLTKKTIPLLSQRNELLGLKKKAPNSFKKLKKRLKKAWNRDYEGPFPEESK